MTWDPPRAKWSCSCRSKASASKSRRHPAGAALLGAALISAAGAAAAACPSAQDLLDALIGSWEGRAVRTPRGPLPYDIELRRTADGAVEGIAEPGAARHHWTFFREDGALRLRFLTTFGGNTAPLHLRAVSRRGRSVVFRARQPDYLEVWVTPRARRIDIEVRLHEEPHVDIRLQRKETNPLE